MTTNHFICSTRDLKYLLEMVDLGLIRLHIHAFNKPDFDFIGVTCCNCDLYMEDNNSGRLLFNVKIHLKLKHGVEFK
jgi:hypothetical protein